MTRHLFAVCMGLILALSLLGPRACADANDCDFHYHFTPVSWNEATREFTVKFSFISRKPADLVTVELYERGGVRFLSPTTWTAGFPTLDSNISLIDMILPDTGDYRIGVQMGSTKPRLFFIAGYTFPTVKAAGDTLPEDPMAGVIGAERRQPGEFTWMDSILGPPQGREPTTVHETIAPPETPPRPHRDRLVTFAELRLIEAIAELPLADSVDICMKLSTDKQRESAEAILGDLPAPNSSGLYEMRVTVSRARVLSEAAIQIAFAEDCAADSTALDLPKVEGKVQGAP